MKHSTLAQAFEPTKQGYLKYKAESDLHKASVAGQKITTMIDRGKLEGRSHEVRQKLHDFYEHVSQTEAAQYPELEAAFEAGRIFEDQPKCIWAINVQNILEGKNEYLLDYSTMPEPGQMN